MRMFQEHYLSVVRFYLQNEEIIVPTFSKGCHKDLVKFTYIKHLRVIMA